MIKWLALGMAIIALTFSIFALRETYLLGNEVEEVKTATYSSLDKAMSSVADSFKLNRLNYNLHWRTLNGSKTEVGAIR